MPSFPWLRPAALALLLSVAGCAHVPPSSLAQLSRLDLMTSDLKVMRAAVRAPAALAPLPRGAKLVLTYWRDGEEKKNVSAVLVEDTDPEALGNLAPEVTPGMRITVFRIPETERARLEITRAAVVAARAGTQDGRRAHVTLSVSVEGCAREPLPEGPVLLTTYLKATADGDFIPLVRDLDLRSLKTEDGASAAALKACTA